MRQHLGFVQRFLLLVTPLFASSVLATSPSQAATLALSQGNFSFTDFSQSPSNISTDTNIKILAIAAKQGGGTVKGEVNTAATFLVSPPTASNSSLSIALGENRNYLGQAESQATVIGVFDVNANTAFSFNFTGNLNLKTLAENTRQQENAEASGAISFVLLNTADQSVLDFFNLEGNVVTPGDNDFIGTEKSDNVTLSTLSKDFNFGDNEEFATASFQGSLNHFFTDKISLALVEVKQNKATVVAVLEPSTSLALLISSSVIGIGLKGRRKENTQA